MADVCKGSWYGDDWQVYTAEDQRACQEAGGTVVPTSGGGGGCGSTTLAAMAVGPESPTRGVLAEIALDPLRRARSLFGDHEFVRAVLEANRVAAPEVERIAQEHPEVQGELIAAFIMVAGLGKVLSSEPPEGDVFDKDAFASLERAGATLSRLSKNPEAKRAIDHALVLAKPFVGMSLADMARKLKGSEVMDGHVQTQLPASAVLDAITATRGNFSIDLRREGLTKIISSIGVWENAQHAIEQKAAAIGAGAPHGDTQWVPGGWRRRYENADIYVGDSGEAFEVHGEIRAKYNLLGGAAGPLGLPVTDEQGTPDRKGRYNHFEHNGSIYWTDTTGPFMVRGRVRHEWAAQGWEAGPMGYPVHDQQAMPALYPTDYPNLGWCLFQNGGILSIAGAAAAAVYAEITPDQMRTMIRSFFDSALKAVDSHVGLQPAVELDAVSDWSYGFWAALPRMVSFSLHGWRDLNDKTFLGVPGAAAPDTTFDLHLRLRFSTTWTPAFTYPSALTVIAHLDWIRVHATGIGSGTLANLLSDGIVKKFYRGKADHNHPEVPDGAVFITSIPTGASQAGNGNLDVIDVLTTAQGGLQILLNSLPPEAGGFRKLLAQNRVNSFLGM